MSRVCRPEVTRRGAVLIVVLGVLVVLSLLAITFAEVSAVDHAVARTYLDGVRAQLLARAGIERGVGEINNTIERGTYNDRAMIYWGNNTSETGSPDASVPLHRALNPSFAIERDPDPTKGDSTPMEFEIDGVKTGLSGAFKGSSTHGANGDVYKLRIVDANSMIHVNDGADVGNRSSTSRNLARILDALGRQVGVPDAGQRLIAARPPGGYRSKRELEPVLGAEAYTKIRNYVTTVAWVDRNVVNPVPLSAETLSAYPVPYNNELGLYRYGRSFNDVGAPIRMPLKFAPEFCSADGIEHTIMAMDELNAQWIERAGRAPVNVNVAAKPVLVALLTGLRGFFVAERRKSNPGQDLYHMRSYTKAENAPGGMLGDEYGFLYSTPEIVSTTGGSDGGTTAASGGGESGSTLAAETIADELIYCRGRQQSPRTNINYGTIWYGGPFKSWRQFNAFCDGLIDRFGKPVSFNYSDPNLGNGGLLRDPRQGLYYDYLPSGNVAINGSDTILPSIIMPFYAAQAIADVLKANFNPNCTLNELNPDENLFMTVDKTDLICNSTEFCFTPMGYYEIDCEGIVVEPADGQDLMTVRKGTTVATKTISCVLKAFDVHRDTTQADFYPGESGFRPGHSPITNNNRTMEIGPEPDNGIAPFECKWSGWLQLSTVGGDSKLIASSKERRMLQQTEPGSSERGEVLHAHFQLDHSLGYHSGGDSPSFRSALLANKQCRNNPDRTESEPGPYGPTRGTPGQYRLARDWNLKEYARYTGAEYSAPSDLRLDGAYVERDCSVMWRNTLDVFSLVGSICMWAKPSYQPSLTGKVRTWFTCDTAASSQKCCSLWSLAAHDRNPFSDPVNEWAIPTYPAGPWRPSCLIAAISEGFGGHGMWTPSLNHRGHADNQLSDLMKAHGWIHVTMAWDMPNKPPGSTYNGYEESYIWVNGELQRFSSEANIHPNDASPEEFMTNGNPIRLGEPSKTWVYFPLNCSRNWTADCTFDEFYMWKGIALARGQDIYSDGRYYRPGPGYEAIYTSAPLPLAAPSRGLPPPSNTAAPPVASGTGTQTADPPQPGKGGLNIPGIHSTQTAPVGQTRILAAFMTLYPETHSLQGVPMIVDHHGGTSMTYGSASADPLRVETEIDFMVNKKAKNRVATLDGGPIESLVVSDTDEVKYFLKVRVPQATVDSILHATPIIDDVTIFHTKGPEFLSYELQETAL